MKTEITCAIILAASLLANATTKAEPLIWSDSNHTELQTAYDNRDLPQVYYERATNQAQRFCVASQAHKKGDWEICMEAITSVTLAEKMVRLATIAEKI